MQEWVNEILTLPAKTDHTGNGQKRATMNSPHARCVVPGGVPSRARFEQQNQWVSFPKDLKRGPYRLRFQAEAAFQTQHIT